MEAVLFVEYPKCSTCKKAKKWLDEHGIPYTDRHIVEDNPSSSELKSWQEKVDYRCVAFLIQVECFIEN